MPSKVTNLTESGATSDSVSASWSPPDGVYDGYRVVCSNGSNSGPNNVTSHTTMFTCNNLPTPGETYTITVITLSGDQESEPCPINITACKLVYWILTIHIAFCASRFSSVSSVSVTKLCTSRAVCLLPCCCKMIFHDKPCSLIAHDPNGLK